MKKEELAEAYSKEYQTKEYRQIAYDAFLCGYGAKCDAELPEGLDEAAENYEYEKGYIIYPDIKEIFKAGVEWAFGQGETVEGFIAGTNQTSAVLVIPRGEYVKGDKVIVQIRKK